MRKTIKMSMGVGFSSLIMIFVVLVAATLATLTLETAHADYKLAIKSAEGPAKFYVADSKAEELLAHINEILGGARISTLEKELLVIPEVKVIDSIKGLYLSYPIAMDDKRILSIMLKVAESAEKDELSYKIMTWHIENNSTWDYDQGGLGFKDIIRGE